MSGVAIVRSVLANNSSLTAQVPAARIMAGILPIGTNLPAISILQISATPSTPVDVDANTKLITERVQVTVIASTYPEQKTLIESIRDALPLSRGQVASFYCDSIVLDSEGPDIYDADLVYYMQTNDFMVRFKR